MFELTPSCPFAGVGLGSIIPHGSITFLMPKNYRTESIVFDVVEVNHPFNVLLS
jgi:hypothetical protein